MTHDVALPFAQSPRFPDRCIVCDRQHPEDRAGVVVLVAQPSRSSLAGDAMDLLMGSAGQRADANRRITLHPSCCTPCKAKVVTASKLFLVAQYTLPCIGVLLFVVSLGKGYTYLGIAGLVCGILAPGIWSLAWPPALGATTQGNKLVYEFKSERCAIEFKELNDPESSPS